MTKYSKYSPGKIPELNDLRNKELIKDYQAGLSIVRLVAKYRISSARIYDILKQYNTPTNREATGEALEGGESK